MQNWWLASLEYFGLVSRDEALHISGEIKNAIHKDNYADCYEELAAIMFKSRVNPSNALKNLESRVLELNAEIVKLKEQNKKPNNKLAQKLKV